MITTYGSISDTAPEGFLPRRVHFKTLVRLNEGTKEGMLTRVVHGNGFGVRELPLDVKFQEVTGEGHSGARLGGRLDMVKIDGNNVEGLAWMADTEDGRTAYGHLARNMLRGNSIDMADVKVSVDMDFEGDELSITANFLEANIAATTLCSVQAFALGSGELEAELTASLAIEGDLEVDCDFVVNLAAVEQLTAANTIFYSHEAFTVEEPDEYTPFQVSRDGKTVFGHLGSWEGCHTGFLDRCVRIPRSRTNYSKYCCSPQPTDKGRAWTGPLLFLEGHKATREAINKALESMENVWANIVVSDGKFGPWACGTVLPDVTDEQLARARSGRVSGHWLSDELYAVVSVPVSGFEQTRNTEYTVELDEYGEVEYLAASFAIDCGCEERELSLDDRLARIEEKLGLSDVHVEDLDPAALATATLLLEELDADEANA